MTILDEFDRLPRWGDPDPGHLRERFLESHRERLRRALRRDAEFEHLQGEFTVERTHNGALSEAYQWLAEAARERDEARALHADISQRCGSLSAQLSEALREIERLKAALRNQNVSGIT